VLPSFVVFLGFVELILAIVASSYCCCCSTWETSDVSLQLNNTDWFTIGRSLIIYY